MRSYRTLVVVCVVLGIVLRARGFVFGTRALWLDEATWAGTLIKSSLLEPSIRPVGFMAVTKFLVWCFGAREVVLRLLPWLAGVGATLLIVPLAERLLRNRAARLLLIGAITLHPAAIDFSKEFKPYELSLFLHLACLFFALRYLDTRRTASLVATYLTALVGLLFAQDLVFALPGLYLALTVTAWRQRHWAHVQISVGLALVTLLGLLALYYYFWHSVGVGARDDSFWARKYDVFFLHRRHGEQRWHWLLRKYGEIAAFPATRREYWQGFWLLSNATTDVLATLYGALWMLLHAVGLGTLVLRRRFTTLALLFLPLVILLLFNWLGFWPFGAFRTNLFVLAYATPLAAIALESSPSLERYELLPVLAAVVLPLVVFERDWHAHKRWAGESEFFDLSATLVALQGPPTGAKAEPLLLDDYSCQVFNFYLTQHPDYRAFGRKFNHRFTRSCKADREAFGAAEQEASEHRVWLVLGNPRESTAIRRQLPDISNLVEYREMYGGELLLELGPGRI